MSTDQDKVKEKTIELQSVITHAIVNASQDDEDWDPNIVFMAAFTVAMNCLDGLYHIADGISEPAQEGLRAFLKAQIDKRIDEGLAKHKAKKGGLQ